MTNAVSPPVRPPSVHLLLPHQAVRQVLGIMGSSELLGNPVGLLVNIAAGVKVIANDTIESKRE